MFKKLIYLVTFFLFTQINITYGKEVKFSQTITPLDPHEYSRLLKLYTNAKKADSQKHELINAVSRSHKLHIVFVKMKLNYLEKETRAFTAAVSLESQRIHYAHVYMKPG